MSWDLMVTDARTAPATLDEAARDWRPGPMGGVTEVRAKLTAVHPGIDWSDPMWGVLEGEGWTIELRPDSAETVTSIALNVRGSGDPVTAVADLCRANGWVAIDLSTGEFLDNDAPSRRGWEGFTSFRDGVVDAAGDAGGPSLRRSGLTFRGGVLTRAFGDKVLAVHDLRQAKNLRLERGLHWASLRIAVVLAVLAMTSKLYLPGWPGWVLAGVLGLLVVPMAMASWGTNLCFEAEGSAVTMALVGTEEEISEFFAELTAALGA